jgi:hypothetical protein
VTCLPLPATTLLPPTFGLQGGTAHQSSLLKFGAPPKQSLALSSASPKKPAEVLTKECEQLGSVRPGIESPSVLCNGWGTANLRFSHTAGV